MGIQAPPFLQGFETLQVLSRVSHSPPTTFSGQLQLKLALAFATAKFGRHVPPFLQGLGAVSQRVVHFLPSLLRGALLGHPQVLLLLEVLLVLPLVVVVVVLTQTPVSQSEGTLQNCPNLHFVEQLPPQSTSLSSASLAPLKQSWSAVRQAELSGLTSCPLGHMQMRWSLLHTLLTGAQSLLFLQACPKLQPLAQVKPQSTSVSSPWSNLPLKQVPLPVAAASGVRQRPLGVAFEPAGQLHFLLLVSQFDDEQSLACLQEKPLEHFQQVLPPQSVSVSSLSLTPFQHGSFLLITTGLQPVLFCCRMNPAGHTQRWLCCSQLPLLQSAAVLQASPRPHLTVDSAQGGAGLPASGVTSLKAPPSSAVGTAMQRF